MTAQLLSDVTLSGVPVGRGQPLSLSISLSRAVETAKSPLLGRGYFSRGAHRRLVNVGRDFPRKRTRRKMNESGTRVARVNKCDLARE